VIVSLPYKVTRKLLAVPSVVPRAGWSCSGLPQMRIGRCGIRRSGGVIPRRPRAAVGVRAGVGDGDAGQFTGE
jgi:hypothetical protein